MSSLFKSWSSPATGTASDRRDSAGSIGTASESLATLLQSRAETPRAETPTKERTRSIANPTRVQTATCGHCHSEQCCNELWPMKDLAHEVRSAGVLGPFDWCGLTVFVAVAGARYESQETIEYRRSVLDKRLQNITMLLDIPVPERAASPINPPRKVGFEKLAVPDREYTLEEVRAHSQKDDVWVAVEGHVLNVTEWQHQHPGGADVIMQVAGEDATAEFTRLHEPGVIEQYAPGTVIGRLVESPPAREVEYEVELEQEPIPLPRPRQVSAASYDIVDTDEDSESEGSGPDVIVKVPEVDPQPQDPFQDETCDTCHHSTGPGSIQCECAGTEVITLPRLQSPAETIDASKPASAEVAAEVTSLLSQLQALLGTQGNSLSTMFPKLAIQYQCEDAGEDEEEGIHMELVVKFKAKAGVDGQHPMCVQARAALGADGRCGGR